MAEDKNIDNIRYAMENQEYFQRQVEEVANALINKNNEENPKVFSWFIE